MTEPTTATAPRTGSESVSQVLIERPPHGFLSPRPAVLAAQPATPPQAINVRSVLDALRRRWFIALVCGLTAGAGAAYAAWTLVPTPYTAYTEIRIRSVMPTVPLKSANKEPAFETFKQTHMQLVRSRDVLDTAVRKSNITSLSYFQDDDEFLSGHEVEFLQRRLEVKSSSIEFFRISLSGARPDELQKIVMAVTKAYQVEVVDAERIALESRRDKYKEILFGSKLGDKGEEGLLEIKREKLHKLVAENASKGKASVERQQGVLSERAALRQHLAEVEIKMMNLNMLRQAQEKKKKPGKKPQEQPIPQAIMDAAMAIDPEFRDAKTAVEELKARVELQKSRLTSNHPDLLKSVTALSGAQKKLDALRKKHEPDVRNRLQSELRSQQLLGKVPRTVEQIVAELAFLKKQQEFYSEKLRNLTSEESVAGVNDVKIAQTTEEVQSQQAYNQALRNEITRMTAELELLKKEARVIIPDRAEVSSRPNKKKQYMGTAAAGFGTFGFILAGIVLLDIRLKRISSLQQVAERVGLTVLGSIPAIPRTATSRKGGDWSSKARYWHSVLTESVDSARTVLLREAEQGNLQVLMIASAMGGEGKTSVSCHLATSLARCGRKTLLVDGDMRRPFIHQTFDIPLQPGFAEILRGDAELSDALHESDIPGLTILPGGRITQSSLELLAQDRPGELLAELRTQFDFIVFDSPPVLPVTDSLLIAQHVDAVLFTIRRDVSRASKVLASCEKLHRLGVPLLGAIAVGLDDDAAGYGYSYRYGYNPYNSVPPK